MSTTIRVTVHFILPFLLIGLLCLTSGCERNSTADVNRPILPRPVKAIELVPAGSCQVHTFPGTAKATLDVDLSFRVGGPLTKLNVDTGELVLRGAEIARVDTRDFRVRVNTLIAKLAGSRAKLVEAELQYKRYSHLIETEAVAKSAYDRVTATYEAAAAQVEADAKNLEEARNALQDTILNAPFTGYVHNKYVENNEIVTAGQPVVSLVDLSVMEVEVSLPEDLLPRVDKMEKFLCRFDALPGKRFRARLKEIGKKPNASNRTYPLTLTLESLHDEPVRPGMAAEVNVTEAIDEDQKTFLVPVTAIVNERDQQTYVWVVDTARQTVLRKPVQTGSLEENGVRVQGDLSPGQWIVVAGVHSLDENQKVRILAPPSSSNVGREH